MSDQSDATTIRKPPAPPNPSPKAAAPVKAKPKTVNVTYIPQHGDAAETSWHGHNFQANKPVAIPEDHPLLEQAKTNPWFNVEGHDPAAPKSADDRPTDSDGYRQYAIAWFKTMTSSAQMKARWEKEEGLRQACGVGSDDLEYLNKLYTPRLAELVKVES